MTSSSSWSSPLSLRTNIWMKSWKVVAMYTSSVCSWTPAHFCFTSSTSLRTETGVEHRGWPCHGQPGRGRQLLHGQFGCRLDTWLTMLQP